MLNIKLITPMSVAMVLLLCTAPLSARWFPLNAPEIVQATPKQTNPVASPKRLVVTFDETGTIRGPVSQLQGPSLIPRMRGSVAGVTMVPSATASMRIIVETTMLLQTEGIIDLQVAGFVTRYGRLFATFGLGAGYPADPPVLALDGERLSDIAKSSGLVHDLTSSEKPLLYVLFMNEIGGILGVEQLRGPHIRAVESELLRTRVLRCGTRGAERVPIAFAVEVEIE